VETFVIISVKELLQQMIERMSNAEGRHLLEFAQYFQHTRDDSLTLKRLATDPAFKVPGSGARDFQVVAPIHGKGMAASRLLVDDRRRSFIISIPVYGLSVTTCAERGGAEVLVTTDDAFVSAARRPMPASSTHVVNPVVYALEPTFKGLV
jgi:hypothetical protein